MWKHLFVRVAVTHASKEGTRAIFTGTDDVSLGIPLTVTMTPIELGGGWRFVDVERPLRALRRRRALLLAVLQGNVEVRRSPARTSSERSPATKCSAARSSASRSGWSPAGEAQYRGVPNAIGDAGLSQEFSETNLGGFTVRFTIGIRKTGR